MSEPKMGRPRTMTLQKRVELHQLRQGGMKLEDCARWLDTSRASVSRYLAMPLPTADQVRAEIATPPGPPRKTALERRIDRFWAKVENANVRGRCWLWQGYLKPSGHGLTTWHGRPTHAHRLAWMLKRGEIPDDMCINHKCHDPRCCNPNHMYVGTRQQNMEDRWGYTRYRVQKTPRQNTDTVSPSNVTTK